MLSRTIAAALAITALSVGGAAMGGEGVQVKITNDSTDDVIVTVYDMNAEPQRVVLTNARINGFTSVPVSLIGDESGRAKLSWTATSASAVPGTGRRCGHASAVAGDDDTVNVHADASCSA